MLVDTRIFSVRNKKGKTTGHIFLAFILCAGFLQARDLA